MTTWLGQRRRDDTTDALLAALVLAIVALVLGAVYAAHLHPPMMLAGLAARRTGCGGPWAYVVVEGLRAVFAARRPV